VKKYFLILACLAMAGIFTACCSKNEVTGAPKGLNIKEARSASLEWLGKLDKNWYVQSYDELAAYSKERITSAQWQADMATYRKPLGSVESRKEIYAFYEPEFPNAPKSEYMVIQYGTLFSAAPKSVVVEAITLMKQEDGSWKVSGYFMK